MLILSGSIIPFVFFDGYSQLLLVFALFTGVYFFIKLFSINIKVEKFLFLLFVIMFLILHALLKSSNSYLSTYFGLILRFVIAFFISNSIDFEGFIKKYINVIIIIVTISLVFFFIGIIYPSFIMKLPISYNDAGTGYRCAYIYFYQGIFSWNYRNNGIFWEGGAFQIFINMALLFRLFYLKQSFGKYIIGTIILILGVLTTVSSIGIFVLAMMLFLLLQNQKPLFRYFSYFVSLVVIIASGFVERYIINKFSGTGTSGSERLAGIFADLNIFINHFLIGAGFDYIDKHFDEIAYSYGAIIPSSTNSFSGSLALYGVIFTSIICFLFFKLIANIHQGILFQIVIISSFVLLLCTQGVIFQLLFICFMLYGIEIQNIGGNSNENPTNP
jgi:hypothetical protein